MGISHKKREIMRRGRNRKLRPKTFKTEQLANAWAKAHKIANYKLVDLKPNAKVHKFRIVYH